MLSVDRAEEIELPGPGGLATWLRISKLDMVNVINSLGGKTLT
ncbi:hypothetical protein FP2506_11452 [Fulvimarina pelagi HTCC2506]|uniref:Uncharacterized protein n=1 Tax=Fulvimarina pelagi HTCC2506 TaxID=314231 RepID=Q0FYY9_9HYPH|nr:hypothetical protein FP2506_11452 [Fulvimarina pelagi HTCC2506]